ncbi:serine hydrolase domain-containing protein [Quadrisphaera setariae]|uniref:serine hydrolase domain-containing protein n=1 Tax=Quadrisphaera setariae TaxID=2593304 RepID=UPI0016505088|nr:serine hydrolase domain-containing protein [Quadrisphaera setariae]
MSALRVHALADGYGELADLATSFVAQDPGWPFQLAVHADGGLLADLAAGAGYDDPDHRALHLQASATKGVAGVSLALALQDSGASADDAVSRWWPEFAAGGKERVTVAQLASHQVGLLAARGRPSLDDWGRSGAVAADLAAQSPAWAAGAGHGYHALTVGPLVDELVHRLSGLSVVEHHEQRVRAPTDIDFWLRLPAEQLPRLHPVEVPGGGGGPGPSPGSLTDLATGQLDAIGPGNAWVASRALLDAGVASVSGAGSALGLSQVYARATGVDGRAALLSADTTAEVARLRTAGTDLVLGVETRFAVLFQKPSPRHDFGTAEAFGHDGAGGALGFADPGTGVAFGFTTGRVPQPAGADRRALAFAAVLRRLRWRRS